jgi:hypothetical protein
VPHLEGRVALLDPRPVIERKRAQDNVRREASKIFRLKKKGII